LLLGFGLGRRGCFSSEANLGKADQFFGELTPASLTLQRAALDFLSSDRGRQRGFCSGQGFEGFGELALCSFESGPSS
jgi:hypothetical protein